MVATNYSPEDLNFRAGDLAISEKEEEVQLYNEVSHVVSALLDKLRPIMAYVDYRIMDGVRGVVVIDNAHEFGLDKLVLTRDCKWCTTDSQLKFCYDRPKAWEDCDFSEVVKGLNDVFETAVARKRESLASVERRATLLKQILTVINHAE